jgi:hypothetical protein
MFKMLGNRIVLAVVMLVVGLGCYFSNPLAAYSSNGFPYESPYAELSGAWTQWVVLEPVPTNPLINGAYGGLNQVGPTWFLAGSETDAPVTRSVTIPYGKELFFPIISYTLANGPIPHPLPAIWDETQERTMLNDFFNGFDKNNLSCIIDGHYLPLDDIHRTQSPALTLMLTSDNNVFGGPSAGAPAGFFYPVVSDGFWVWLEQPLALGEHTLQFTAVGPLSQDITYNITVVPLPGTLLLLGTGVLGLLGFGIRKRS